MKKLLLLLLVFIGAWLQAYSQIEVKPDSFKKTEGFVNLDEDRLNDLNGQPYAVLKIATENINNKQRRAFRFSVDNNISYEIVYKKGEIWLFISYYVHDITITNPEFNTIKYTIPMDMEPKCGYEMKIVNKAAAVEMGFAFVDIDSKPVKGATIFIDGQMMNKKTPYTIELSPGQYNITVMKELYEAVTKTVVLKADDDVQLDFDMPLGTGAKLTLNADKETSVYVNGEFKGKGTWSDIVKEGQYSIVGKKPNHNDVTKYVTLAGKDVKTFDLNPTPIVKEVKEKPQKASRQEREYHSRGIDWEPRDGFDKWSLSVEYAFDKNGTNSIGLTYNSRFTDAGMTDSGIGMFITMYGNWFAKGKYPKLTCDKDFLIEGYYPAYKDNFQAHNFTILAGYSMLNDIAFSMRLGLGYQKKWIAYELDFDNANLPDDFEITNPYVRNKALTYEGMAFELGCSYFIGDEWGVVLSFDVVTCLFKTVDYKFGIGIAF